MELISREDAIKSLTDYKNNMLSIFEMCYGIEKHRAEDCIKIIESLPTVEERKEGHWIPYLPEYGDMFKCSECNEITRLPFKAIRMPYKCCPYCEARMKGE